MEYLLEAISEKKREALVNKAIKEFNSEINKSDLTNTEKKCIKFIPVKRILKSKDFFSKRGAYIGAYNFKGLESNPYLELRDICKKINDKNDDFKVTLVYKTDTVSIVVAFLFGILAWAVLDECVRKKKVGAIQITMSKKAIKEMYEEAYYGEKAQYDALLESYNELLSDLKK